MWCGNQWDSLLGFEVRTPLYVWSPGSIQVIMLIHVYVKKANTVLNKAIRHNVSAMKNEITIDLFSYFCFKNI